MRGKPQIDTEEMRVLFEDEMLSDLQIGQRLGLREASAARLRRRRGFIRREAPNARSRIPEAELKMCDTLLSEGYSYRATAELTGVDKKAIARHFPGRGFTPAQSAELTAMSRRLGKIK